MSERCFRIEYRNGPDGEWTVSPAHAPLWKRETAEATASYFRQGAGEARVVEYELVRLPVVDPAAELTEACAIGRDGEVLAIHMGPGIRAVQVDGTFVVEVEPRTCSGCWHWGTWDRVSASGHRTCGLVLPIVSSQGPMAAQGTRAPIAKGRDAELLTPAGHSCSLWEARGVTGG